MIDLKQLRREFYGSRNEMPKDYGDNAEEFGELLELAEVAVQLLATLPKCEERGCDRIATHRDFSCSDLDCTSGWTHHCERHENRDEPVPYLEAMQKLQSMVKP